MKALNTLESVKYVMTVNEGGRTFEIVKKNGWYCAIEDKYIDENNRLTQQLTGLQMCASQVLDVCISGVKVKVFTEAKEAEGVDIITAVYMYHNPDVTLEDALVKTADVRAKLAKLDK